MANDETLAALDRVAAHLQRALCMYVDGDDTRATELTDEELRDIARAIIPIIRDEERAQIVALTAERDALASIVRGWHWLAVGPDEMGDYLHQRELIKASEPYASPALKALAKPAPAPPA